MNNAPDYPYKRIRVTARKFGYKGLSKFELRDTNCYTAFDRHSQKRILVDIEQQRVWEWDMLRQELVEQ